MSSKLSGLKHDKHVLSPVFCGLGIWGQLGWTVLPEFSSEVAVKLLAWAAVI